MFSISKSSRYLKVEKELQKEIGKALEEMEEVLKVNPKKPSSRIKKLTNHEPPYRYRIGHYRIFYDVEGTEVHLLTIKDRKEAYRKK